MEFGMFHEFQRSQGQSETEAFDLSFEQVDAAEDWGLDVMWLAELHAAPTRSVLSAPLNVATAIAARTSRMKIGTAVQVLPLCHPLRIAEEAATVDQISHGRLIFGVGRSGFPRTYQAYGVPYAESRERFAETLEILKRAWTEESFSYDGQVLLVSQCPSHARSRTRSRFRSCASRSTARTPSRRSGRSATRSSPRSGSARSRSWRRTSTPIAPPTSNAGHPGGGKVYLRLPVYIADTYQRARDEAEESVMHFYRWLGDQLEASASQAGARADRAARRTRPAAAADDLRGGAARQGRRRRARRKSPRG